jgi:predicted metal-dependent hydrolase
MASDFEKVHVNSFGTTPSRFRLHLVVFVSRLALLLLRPPDGSPQPGYQIEVVDDGTREVCFAPRFVIPTSRGTERKGAMQEWYVMKAETVILPRARRHATELGVQFSKAMLVDNRYRWGSCTVQDNANFNWRLIKAPMFVIDFVIVHELAHLVEANHTRVFWNVVRTQAPKMAKAKTWLKDNGQILEEDV